MKPYHLYLLFHALARIIELLTSRTANFPKAWRIQELLTQEAEKIKSYDAKPHDHNFEKGDGE